MDPTGKTEKIKNMINEIITICKGNQNKTYIAISNFQTLIDAMVLYERAPKYYNSLLEESETPIIQNNPQYPTTNNSENSQPQLYKYPIVGELEGIYHQKLKQLHLQKLGTALASKLSLKLDRKTKRNKAALLQWFSSNWNVLHQKIYEFGLHRMDFSK